MPQNKNFIITQDKTVSTYLLANGFYMVSNINNTYTFINDEKVKLNFEEIDNTKIYFTNILTF